MQCTYYYHDVDRNFRQNFCFKKDGIVKGKYCRSYCSNSNYDNCPIYCKNKDSNCFFTTILCEKLGLSYDNLILINLNNFRKNILEKKECYRELLVCHDRISPIISAAIRSCDIQSIDEILGVMYSNFLIPINNFIINGEVDKAIFRYKKMLELLVVYFSLGKEFADVTYYYKYPERYKFRTKLKKKI